MGWVDPFGSVSQLSQKIPKCGVYIRLAHNPHGILTGYEPDVYNRKVAPLTCWSEYRIHGAGDDANAPRLETWWTPDPDYARHPFRLLDIPLSKGMIGGGTTPEEAPWRKQNAGFGEGNAGFLAYVVEVLRQSKIAAEGMCPSRRWLNMTETEQKGCCKEYQSKASYGYPEGHVYRLDYNDWENCACRDIRLMWEVDGSILTDDLGRFLGHPDWTEHPITGNLRTQATWATFRCETGKWEAGNNPDMKNTIDAL